MGNTSATGGVLLPAQAAPADDDLLDKIFQNLIVAITGLPATLVFPRWQPDPPKQPAASVNWCGIGVTVDEGDNPAITYDPDACVAVYKIQTQLSVLATFNGPASRQYARQLRDGLRIPQNTEGLLTSQIRFSGSGPIRNVSYFVNTGWIRRYDLQLRFAQEVIRTYPIGSLKVVVVNLTDGTGIDDTIIVPPGTSVEP